MKLIKKILRYSIVFLAFITLYLLVAVVVSKFSVNSDVVHSKTDKTIYLSTNGIHLSVIIPSGLVSEDIKKGLHTQGSENYYMFGWGNEDFYINTPTWDDFKFKYAFNAFFMDTPTAIHLTTYKQQRKGWVEVKCNQQELVKLNTYITQTFKLDENGQKQLIPCNTYDANDYFYKAKGSYAVYRTCNTWVNSGFKQSGLKASVWTIFDFGLLGKYKK